MTFKLFSNLTTSSGTTGRGAAGGEGGGRRDSLGTNTSSRSDKAGAGEGKGEGGVESAASASASTSPSACYRCGQPFTLFFNKKVTCGGCYFSVCRKCAPWNSSHKAYVCSVCSKPPLPQSASATLGNGGGIKDSESTTNDAQLKDVEASVHSHIEALVEGQIGSSLDQVTSQPNISTPHRLVVFRKHHAVLSQALEKLSYALQMSILNRPLPTEDIPTSRHTQLTERISRTIKDAMILPAQIEGYDPVASPETPVEDFNSHTYEDILATAILNKVLESCEGERPNEVTIEVSHEVTSTDTDSGMSGGVKESRRRRGKRSELSEAGSECSEDRSLTPQRSRSPPVSPDQGVVTDDSWAQAAAGDGPPLQFKIEEHVEEITTHHLTDDDQDLEGFEEEDVSDSGSSWRGSRLSLDDSRRRPRRREKISHHVAVAEDGLLSTLNIPLPDPSFAAARRVSFPELGADILQDSCSDTECCSVGPGDMVVEAESWEENWLFRRQKLVSGNHDSVSMLIPNPDAYVPTTVGNRDIDELSELSERHSVGSSETWSTSDSEAELESKGKTYHTYTASKELSTLAGEIVAEFAQQDQEYTVDYSVPSRVTASKSPEHNVDGTKSSISLYLRPQAQDNNTNQNPKAFTSNKLVDGIKNPATRENETLPVDTDQRYETERPPVPKPRKLSLANSPSSKTSVKSPVLLLPSPSEDLSILSAPLDVPHLKNAHSKSDSVWFVGVPEDCTVAQGRTLRLVFQVNTKKPMGLSWYHNGSLVSVNDRDLWVWRKGSYHHLHVYSMSPSKSGVYAAAAYTASDCVWAFCQVQHKASSRPQKRPAFSKGLSDTTVEEGAELYLQCQVTGHPEPRIVFSKGSEKLAPSPRVSVESDQYGTWTLRISDCSALDSGEISATVTNSIATISTHCRVRIVPEGTLPPQNGETIHSRNLNSSSNKQSDSYTMSSNCHKIKKPGKHDLQAHDTGSRPSHQSNSSRPSQNNIHLANGNRTTNSFTTPSGVIADTGDIDDIQQVPTKPGINGISVVGKASQPEVESSHVPLCDFTTSQGSDLMKDSELLVDHFSGKVSLHDSDDEPLDGLGNKRVLPIDADGSHIDGDGPSCFEKTLNTVASVSSDYSSGRIDDGTSVSFISEEPLCLSHSGYHSLSYPSGATIDLEYYPSSHEDDDSVLSNLEKGTPSEEPLHLDPLPSSDPFTKASEFVAALNSHAPSLTLGQQHASNTLGYPSCQEHEESPQGNESSTSLHMPVMKPQPGTIAEREHRKWEAAVHLPNNPYAPERLVHRLSHSKSSTQLTQSSHGIKVEIPEDGEGELDPSLRDGVPPQADLTRYSRDYYVPAGSASSSLQNLHLTRSQLKIHQSPFLQQDKGSSLRHSANVVSNGVQEDGRVLAEHPKNQVYIQIAGRGTQGTYNVRGGLTASLNRLGKNIEVQTSRPTDWKDELKDIQAARVEREVARFQRTIDETQRRWEANYARHAPRGPTNIQSDCSAEVLHNPRNSAYFVPPRHDLWRTVSVDTISAPPKERLLLGPLQRHTSVDNLRQTKVSNLRSLGLADQRQMSSMNTVSSISSVNLNSMNRMPSYEQNPQNRKSVDSISGYSDGESHGDGNESDVSGRTQDEFPLLPSVKKLASKFDLASQERVNDLDKHEADGNLTFYGKKNISLMEKSPGEQPYSRNFTNNLNKRIEKPYTMKEVHSLTARSVPRQFREGLRDPPRSMSQNLIKSQPNPSSYSPRRDAPSPEHLGIPWGPATIPMRPAQIPGDTSDDSSAPSGSPRRVPRRRSGGRRDHPGWHTRPECGAFTDPAVHIAADSVC